MIAEINGKKVKFGFGLYFLGKAQKKFNTDLNGLLKSLIKNPIADMVDLMYYSAVTEAELDEVELTITKREFLEYLEKTKDFQDFDGILAKWSGGLVESIKGNFLPDEEPSEEVEDVKKK